MRTLREVREEQDKKVEYLRKLQQSRSLAALELKPGIDREIDTVSKEIAAYDTLVQSLLNLSRPKP